MTTWTPVAHSALHAEHVRRGATMVDVGDWSMPARYAAPEDEAAKVRAAVGIADFSPLGKLTVHGDDLDELLDGAERLEVGRVRISSPSGYEGPGEMAVARVAHDELMILIPPGAAPSFAHLADSLGGCAHVVDVTSGFCCVKVTGPRSRRLLSRLTELDLRDAPFADLSCAQGKLAEIECLVVRRDLNGLLNFDLLFSRDYGEYVWESLVEAGEDLEVIPYGHEAMSLLGGSDHGGH